MLITVKEATGVPVWQSPDKMVSIYDIIDADGNKWSTKSHKIGKGAGQSFEVEVEHKNGKTYLRLPYTPPGGAPQQHPQQVPATPTAVAQGAATSGATLSPQAVERFELAVNKFTQTVTRLENIIIDLSPTGTVENPPHRTFPTTEESIAFLGGKIEDDLDPEDLPPAEIYDEQIPTS